MLDQAQAAAAQQLLTQGQKHELVISDFSLRSIGCHLLRRGKTVEFKQFFQDMVLVGGVQISALAEDQYGQRG